MGLPYMPAKEGCLTPNSWVLVLNLASYLFTYVYEMDVDGLDEDSLHPESTNTAVCAPYFFEESSIALNTPEFDLPMTNCMPPSIDAELEVPWLI